MNKIYLTSITILFTAIAFAQKKNVNTKPFPFQNPVIHHMYTADPSPHVFPDGRVWMVTSVDHEDGGGFKTMHSYHTFSSSDMKNWVDHGEIFNLEDALQGNPEPANEDWALWAPDMIYHNGKYYLYYPVRIIHKNTRGKNGKPKRSSYIAVARADAPDQRFKVINAKIEGTSGIDPAIFIDDDGEKYLYWGRQEAAKLKDNMIELATDPIKLELDDDDFVEASWMHKRKGVYYFSWHSRSQRPARVENPNDSNRKQSTLDYSYGDNPFGPFTFGGVFNYELGVGVKNGPKYPGYDYVPWRLQLSNHGGIVEYHGQEYLFYHTAALSSWRQDEFKGAGTNTQRSVCVDYLNYDENDSVIPVVQTIEGVKPISVKQAYEIPIGTDKLEVVSGIEISKGKLRLKAKKGVIKLKNLDLGSGYYYFGLDVIKTTGNGKIQVYLDKEDGILSGTISLNENTVSENNGTADTFLREANAVHDVYIVFENSDIKSNSIFRNLRFFAGSPKEL